jgi:hypothetical protein
MTTGTIVIWICFCTTAVRTNCTRESRWQPLGRGVDLEGVYVTISGFGPSGSMYLEQFNLMQCFAWHSSSISPLTTDCLHSYGFPETDHRSGQATALTMLPAKLVMRRWQTPGVLPVLEANTTDVLNTQLGLLTTTSNCTTSKQTCCCGGGSSLDTVLQFCLSASNRTLWFTGGT